MAEFAWEARGKAGEVRKGVMEAESEDTVMTRLRQQQLNPTRVKKKTAKFSFQIGTGVGQKDLVTFTRLFATMIDAGLPIVQCLDILANQTDNKHFQVILKDIKGSVEQGSTFSDSLRKHPKVFDPLYCNLVQAGEVGGILDTILNRLAVYIEKNVKLKRQVKGAMYYPTIVLFVFSGVLTVLLVFVIPSFQKMFSDFGAKDALPWLTLMVINISQAFIGHLPLILLFMIAIAVAGSLIYKQPKGKKFTHKTMLWLPIVGPVLEKIAVARFTRTLGTLLSSGVPILDALDIVAKTAGNVIIEEGILYTRMRISEGKNMAGPLLETNVFPPMVVQMVGVGEQTGALDTMLNKIADFYEEEADVAVASLTSLIEPAMMVGIGGTVGVVLIAMYLPDLQHRRRRSRRSRHPARGERLSPSTSPQRTGSIQQGLAGRLAWMTGLRLVFFTLLLIATAVFYLGGELTRYPVSLRLVFFTISGSYTLAALYAAVLKTGRQLLALAYAQIVIDQIAWTAIVYVSGGATSGATSFYALSCLVGASLIGLRGALAAAIAGAASFLLLCVSFAEQWILPPSDQSGYYVTTWTELIYPLLVNGLGICVVAVLAAYLSERLRVAGRALDEANARAQEAERLAVLGRVAAGLAHEIRNPLGSIRGSVEMLGESLVLSPEDQELCAIIRREAIRLNDLVTDMLDLSKIASAAGGGGRRRRARRRRGRPGGEEREERERGRARGLRRARGDDASARGRSADPAGHVEPGPQRRAGKPGRRDRDGGGSPGQGSVELRVDDEGPGIADEAMARIFDAFYTTRAHGLGIGLALVKRIIDEHAAMGGRIEVVSPEKGGASFRVTLKDVPKA